MQSTVTEDMTKDVPRDTGPRLSNRVTEQGRESKPVSSILPCSLLQFLPSGTG